MSPLRPFACLVLAAAALFAVPAPAAHAQAPIDLLTASREQGKIALVAAIGRLKALEAASLSGLISDPFVRMVQQPTIDIVNEWLRVSFDADSSTFHYALRVAMQRMQQNLSAYSQISYTPDEPGCQGDSNYAFAYVGRPDLGVHGCHAVVAYKGPVCRSEVLNHEFFHIVGVNHGEAGGLPVPTNFYARTMAHALDHADHLLGLASTLAYGSASACNGSN